MDDAGYAERKVYHTVISFVTVQLAERIFFQMNAGGIPYIWLLAGRKDRAGDRSPE